MKWDIAFILRGYPQDYRFFDQHYFMADVTEEHIASLLKHTSHLPEVVWYFADRRNNKFTAIGFRIDGDEWGEALKQAIEQIEGFIDGLAILLDRGLPKICPLVHVRKVGDADAILVQLGEPGWAYKQPNDPDIESAWRKRCSRVFDAMNPFFDIVADLHPRRNTALSRQLLYSMKMYRHGASTGVYGLEFICKWSAFEGLVCGGERPKKRLILDRMSALFASHSEKLPDLENLWDLRNEAVHEARAFHSDHLHEAKPLAIELHDVENLFFAVVIFAVHIDRVDSIASLWSYALGYGLPDFAVEKRPAQMPRYAMMHVRFNTNLIGKGIGRMFDDAFRFFTPSRLSSDTKGS
jgi:hypothetical protein